MGLRSAETDFAILAAGWPDELISTVDRPYDPTCSSLGASAGVWLLQPKPQPSEQLHETSHLGQ